MKTVKVLVSFLLAFVLILPAFTSGGKEDASSAEEKKHSFIFGGSDSIGSLLDRSNKHFIELVEERSNGRVEIEFYPADQLGGDIDQIQSTMAGTQHFYGDVIVWLANWVNDFNILGWGFTFRSREHLDAFFESDIYEKMRDEMERKHNVKILGAVATEPRIFFSKNPVTKLDDIKGLKMRVPEIESYLRLWEALGTKPTRVTWSEVYMGLRQGVISACEGPVTASYAAKFHEVAPNVLLTSHLMSTYFLMVNGSAWNDLSDELKDVVQKSADDTLQWCSRESVNTLKDSLSKMENEGATVRELEDKAPWQNAVRDATLAMEEKGLWSGGLYDKIQMIR